MMPLACLSRDHGRDREAEIHDGSVRPSELQVPQVQVGHVRSLRQRLPSVP